MLVNATEMLIKARDGHYGVPQFNINNLEWTKAVLTACEEMKSPVILGVSEGAGKYMTGFKTVAAMVDAMVDSMGITVPVALHLDHGTYEGCKACVEAGFSSITQSAQRSLLWASTYWPPASATSTASTPPTGRVWTSRLWTASIRLPITFLWSCTAAPASPTT